MADTKKFFWLKVKRDFFKRHDVRIIESMPDGKDYLLLYLKLLCESVDHDGRLRFSDEIPYDEQMLSVITDTDQGVIHDALAMFQKLGMMDVLEDGTIVMTEVGKMIGSETEWAEKKRQYRTEKGHDEDNVHPTEDNVLAMSDKSKSKSKSIENKEREIERESPAPPSSPTRHRYGEYQNVMLTDADYDKLKSEFPEDYQIRIERLSSYIASSGKSYKNHLAVIRNWAKKDAEDEAKESAAPLKGRHHNSFHNFSTERKPDYSDLVRKYREA